MIKNQELIDNHIIQKSFPLPPEIKNFLEEENWNAIDDFFLTHEKPHGLLFDFLKEYLEFESIEHIISIRKSPDEDGIWHDDGSRILGFTLSLTLNPEKIVGGELRFKAKENKEYLSLPIRPYGEILLFKTGIYGFEHMVSEVTLGTRILIAGWCS